VYSATPAAWCRIKPHHAVVLIGWKSQRRRSRQHLPDVSKLSGAEATAKIWRRFTKRFPWRITTAVA
jgi:hypothetical protein